MAKLELPVRFLLKKTHGTCKPVTAMKKFMKPFVLVAAAAMALASCQKNEFDAPQKQELHFTIKAGIETKTSITDNGDGTYSPSWHKDDKIGILFTEDKTDKLGATFSNVNADGEIASFEGTATVNGEGTLYAFYPASAFNQHYGDETIRLDLPAAQKPTSTSFDPACDILVAKPCDYLADGETVVIDDLYFARLMSVLKINLKGEFAQGEVVKSLTLTVEDVDITGNAKVDYKTATITAWNNGSVDRNVVTATYSDKEYITIADGNNAAYLVIAPTTIPAGKELTFSIKTANYNISKTVNWKSDMTFTAGNLSVLNLTINEENCEAIVADTRIWVEGFDGETVTKTQTKPSESGVAGTGVSESLEYTYTSSNDNCNVRFNNNGQTPTNPFLYINESNASFTASNIKIANEENLALSAMVKGNGLKLTVEYKESASSTWSSAGKITGTSSYAQGRVIFAVPTTATSLDIRLTGNGVMYVDDIVLESTDEEVPVVTLMSIAISNQKTEYYVGDDFVKPTVTAIYSDETIQDVTGLATFSEYDMNTVGDKTVTVTYEGKSAEYNFTVKEKGASSETVEWVATSFADLKAGDQVVIVGTKSSSTYAMSNDKGASDPPLPVSVTVSNDKLIAEPDNNIIWYVGVDGSNRVFNANEGGSTWLYCTSSNNGVRVGTNDAKTFTVANGYLKHVGTGRFLGIYLTQDWRCYTSHTSTNIANQTFQFFVKQVGGSSEGGETPDPEQPGEGGGETTDPEQPGEGGGETTDPEQPGQGGDDAELKTSSLVLASSKKFGTTSGSTLNADDSQVWKITTISGGAIQNSFNTSYQGQQIGTGTSPWVGTFTSDFSGKNIKSIKILANTGEKASLSVTVGNVDFGTKQVTKNASQALEYLFEGSASGNVTITVSDTKKAFYLGAIVVTYN